MNMDTARFCETCRQVLEDIISGSLPPSRCQAHEALPDELTSPLGTNLKLRVNHASNICILCSEAYKRLSSAYDEDGSDSDNVMWEHWEPFNWLEAKSCFYAYHMGQAAQWLPRETCLEIRAIPKRRLAKSHCVRWEFYRPSLKLKRTGQENEIVSLDIEIAPDFQSRLGSPQLEHSGSPEAMQLASTWSRRCLLDHPRCSGRQAVPVLPTRVVDIGPSHVASNASDYPRLMISNGHRAQYVCLSYRWGTLDQQLKTTRQNLEEHSKHIPLNRLPRLFHDAIQVVSSIGLRYLWIDCLCIVQDDNAEWMRECKAMATVYERGFVTISALGAEDSGCSVFHASKEVECYLQIQTRNASLVGLRNLCPGPVPDLHSSSMWWRGWIMQERLLSPTILHFGEFQMHWECLTGTLSERWAEP